MDHRDVGRLQTLGQHLEFSLLLEAARIIAQRVRGGGRHRVLGLPGQQGPAVRILIEQIARQGGARAGQPEYDQGAFDPLIGDLGVLLDVVDDTQPIPQRVDELAVDEVTPARIDSRCGFAGLDKQPQTFLPRVVAEVFERGTLARPGDEFVEACGGARGKRRRHARRYYTAVENKC